MERRTSRCLRTVRCLNNVTGTCGFNAVFNVFFFYLPFRDRLMSTPLSAYAERYRPAIIELRLLFRDLILGKPTIPNMFIREMNAFMDADFPEYTIKECGNYINVVMEEFRFALVAANRMFSIYVGLTWLILPTSDSESSIAGTLRTNPYHIDDITIDWYGDAVEAHDTLIRCMERRGMVHFHYPYPYRVPTDYRFPDRSDVLLGHDLVPARVLRAEHAPAYSLFAILFVTDVVGETQTHAFTAVYGYFAEDFLHWHIFDNGATQAMRHEIDIVQVMPSEYANVRVADLVYVPTSALKQASSFSRQEELDFLRSFDVWQFRRIY